MTVHSPAPVLPAELAPRPCTCPPVSLQPSSLPGSWRGDHQLPGGSPCPLQSPLPGYAHDHMSGHLSEPLCPCPQDGTAGPPPPWGVLGTQWRVLIKLEGDIWSGVAQLDVSFGGIPRPPWTDPMDLLELTVVSLSLVFPSVEWDNNSIPAFQSLEQCRARSGLTKMLSHPPGPHQLNGSGCGGMGTVTSASRWLLEEMRVSPFPHV